MESKNNDSFLSISSENEDEEDNEDNEDNNSNINKNHSKKEKYHDLFKGITLENFNPKSKDIKETNEQKKEEELNKEYILKLREKLNNNATKIKNRKILILPAPENNLTDNHYQNKNLIDDEADENKGFIKLMNPDNLNVKKNKDTKLSLDNIDNNDKNIISINQKDFLDNNWEIKYINKILKKDMKETIKKEEEEKEENNKNKGGKKRKRDKKDDNELEEENIRSKYSKITTKKRYGW